MKATHYTSGPRVVLRYPRGHEDLATYAQRVHDGIAGEPRITSPNPAMDLFQEHIDAYVTAIKAANDAAPGTVAERQAKRTKVVEDLHHLRDAVQCVSETIPVPADAVAFIEKTGLKVRRRGSHARLPLRVTDGQISGTVYLQAKAFASVSTYYWQYSLDLKTWVDAGDGFKASTLITGLTPGQMVHFRFRARSRSKESEFSQVVSRIVR